MTEHDVPAPAQQAPSQSSLLLRNALISYSRLGVVVLATLAAHRLLLRNLGFEYYGILASLNAIGMFGTMLSTALSTGVQRHLAFEVGRGGRDSLRSLFLACQISHGGLAIFFAAVALLLRPGIFSTMGIPAPAEDAFYLVLGSMVATMLSGAGTNLLIARQRFDLASISPLAIALGMFLGAWIVEPDGARSLNIYMAVVFSVQCATSLWIIIYCARHYEEASTLKAELRLLDLRRILGFFGWNAFAHTAFYTSTQGILLTTYAMHGAVTAAAIEIASKCATLLRQIGYGLSQVVQPAMASAIGSGAERELGHMALQTSKLATLATLAVAVPVLVDAELLLQCWLGTYPEDAPLFSRILVTAVSLVYLTDGYGIAAVARGDIVRPTLITVLVQISVVLSAILIVLFGTRDTPSWLLPGAVQISALLVTLLYVVLLSGQLSITFRAWTTGVLLPVATVASGAAVAGSLAITFAASPIPRIALLLASTTLTVALLSWSIALSRTERSKLKEVALRAVRA